MTKSSFKFLLIFFAAQSFCSEPINWNWEWYGWKAEVTEYGCVMYNDTFTKNVNTIDGLILNLVHNFRGDITDEQSRKGVALEKDFITIFFFDGRLGRKPNSKELEVVTTASVSGEELIEVEFEKSFKHFGTGHKYEKAVNSLLQGKNISISAKSSTGVEYTQVIDTKNFKIVYEMFRTCVKEEKRNKYNQQDSPLRGSPLL